MFSDFETSAHTPAERASFSVEESPYALYMMTGTSGITRLRTRASLQAVHHWHREVQQNQVRVQFLSFLNCLLSVFCLSANVEVLFRSKNLHKALLE